MDPCDMEKVIQTIGGRSQVLVTRTALGRAIQALPPIEAVALARAAWGLDVDEARAAVILFNNNVF